MSTVTVRDDDAIRRLHEHARANADHWDQDAFRNETDCGTTYCMAGFQVYVLDGRRLVTTEDALRAHNRDASAHDPDHVMADAAWGPDGRIHKVADLAAESLGLNDDETHALFYEAETHDEVAQQVRLITADHYR